MAKGISKEGLLRKVGRIMARKEYVLPTDRKELDRFDINHPWVQEVLKYFAEDTTRQIMENMKEMGVDPYNPKNKYTQNLERSIHWSIVNSAGGNGTLVQWYYLKYADYLGLSASGWLNAHYGAIHSGDVPDMINKKGVQVGNRPWKAKPFMTSEIRRKARKLERRLARQFCYAGGMLLFHSAVPGVQIDGEEFMDYVNRVINDDR